MSRYVTRKFDYDKKDQLALEETLFHNANGYIGVRGNLEEGVPAAMHTMRGVYLNGVCETIPMKQAESLCNLTEEKETMVNVGDIQTVKIFIDGQEFSLFEGEKCQQTRILDMDQGTTNRDVTWNLSEGRKVKISVKKMASFVEESLFVLEYSVTAVGFDGKMKLVSYHIPEVCNYANPDDPRLAAEGASYLRTERIETRGKATGLSVTSTEKTKIKVGIMSDHQWNVRPESEEIRVENDEIIYEAIIPLESDKTSTCSKIVIFKDSIREKDVYGKLSETMDIVRKKTLDYYFESQRFFLEKFWNSSEVRIPGDEKLENALNFNIFQLLQSAPQDYYCSIAAKGLSGEGYEGHYFWDTEMFMLPFYVLSEPQVAKRLLEFRYETLGPALENAKLLGHKKGALYPWRTINGKECSGYYVSGSAAYHINGDIAYGVVQYYFATGDYQFIRDKGARILLETARLWMDVGNYHDGSFHIHGVTGPDEYTCLVDDNYYTNRIAQFNLMWAVKAARLMEEKGDFDQFSLDNKLTADELKEMEMAANAMEILYDENLKINPQDSSFLSKPLWDLEATDKSEFPLLLHYHPLHLYRYQVCKQADTVMAYYLFPDLEDQETMENSYRYYEKITTHDSSLSECIYSVVASRLGMKEKAYSYFGDSAKLDLENLHGNTKDGIHTANMGGSYIALVYGFAGLVIREEGLRFKPFLPDKWEGYSFKFQYRGKTYEFSIDKDGARVLYDGENITEADKIKILQ
ncbi:MAG: family 65 glycosyl hydrolase [Pseudobutyrivibrio sp.]|nr:family 65 glycosyl hydrolase [Pseudobutyrivibrio sp.]